MDESEEEGKAGIHGRIKPGFAGSWKSQQCAHTICSDPGGWQLNQMAEIFYL